MIIMLLACALTIAWFGHDIFRTDYHRELGQASWNTGSWRSQVDDVSELPNLAALPTPIIRWIAPTVIVEPFALPLEQQASPLAPSTYRQQVPRPPPTSVLS